MAFQRKDFFDHDRCTLCGKCLAECPVLGYTEEKARAEMERLLRGTPSDVLERCKSCFSCDRFCPYECHPYGLILSRWFERYRREGIPVRALVALPADTRNFLTAARSPWTTMTPSMRTFSTAIQRSLRRMIVSWLVVL